MRFKEIEQLKEHVTDLENKIKSLTLKVDSMGVKICYPFIGEYPLLDECGSFKGWVTFKQSDIVDSIDNKVKIEVEELAQSNICPATFYYTKREFWLDKSNIIWYYEYSEKKKEIEKRIKEENKEN